MSPEVVLIVADEAGAGPAQSLVERWKCESEPPMFAQVRAELWNGGAPPIFTLAVVAGLTGARMLHALDRLAVSGKPVICVCDEPKPALRTRYPAVTVLPANTDSWSDVVVQFANEVFRRLQATNQARRAEQQAASLEVHAALGRYMVEVRHGFNNALTSVLGNSELILMEADNLHPRMREQMESIHSMAIRMHQAMQRFTSLETEMRLGDLAAQSETAVEVKAATAPR